MAGFSTLTPDMRERCAPLLDWLLGAGRQITPTTALLAGFAEQLQAAGVPVFRSTLHIRQLHPLLFSRTVIWHEESGAQEIPRRRDITESRFFQDSPVAAVFQGGAPQHHPISGPPDKLPFPILGDLAAEGATDYVIYPLSTTDGSPMAVTFAIRRKGGFSADDLAVLEAVLPAFAPLVELRRDRRNARTLLETYVGRHAGERILSGEIHRGDGQTISAILWYCDIRDFTALSEITARDALIELLNAFFDATTQPVIEAGGEVLKFIGDAMLAIFPLENGEAAGEQAAAAALAAARQAVAKVAAFNQTHAEQGQTPIHFGLALHVGDVMYGNIGAADRLDFTVIGPAVNLVTRMEKICATCACDIVVSAAFAALCPGEFTSLGRHELRGVGEARELYCPA